MRHRWRSHHFISMLRPKTPSFSFITARLFHQGSVASGIFAKPEWHLVKDGWGRLRSRLDLDQSGHLTLCGSWFGRGFQRCQAFVCTGLAPEGAVRFPRRGDMLLGPEIVVWRDVASYGRSPPRLSVRRVEAQLASPADDNRQAAARGATPSCGLPSERWRRRASTFHAAARRLTRRCSARCLNRPRC